MIRYKCPSCGKYFDPEKNEICPRCGAAVAPSVMTRIERKQTAQRLRAEGKFNYDEHCHEDDAWAQSYGAGTHRAAVRSHEASLRAGYAAHPSADNPNQRPVANPTRVSNANPAAQGGARNQSNKKNPKVLPWLAIAWFLYVLFQMLRSILRN